MLDKFLSKLFEKISSSTQTPLSLSNWLDDDSNIANTKYINVELLSVFINEVLRDLEAEKIREESKKPIEKFMYIEDGSVDTDELIAELEITNPEIKVIVYRHGSQPPHLFDIQSNDK
jgi:hypothetical protein